VVIFPYPISAQAHAKASRVSQVLYLWVLVHSFAVGTSLARIRFQGDDLSNSDSTLETEVLFADEEMAAEAAQVSEALRGRYSVTERLGRGACGEVYKAQDTLLNRVVAIKRIRLDRLGESEHVSELRARFLREAQVATRLQHNGIVSVYDVITFEDTSYLVMEYVEGRTLAQLFASSNKLGAARTVHLLSQVADALAVAHAQKVVHRDIKLANILVSTAGVAKISDFGVAKAESSSEITTVGTILGTPDYMSRSKLVASPSMDEPTYSLLVTFYMNASKERNLSRLRI